MVKKICAKEGCERPIYGRVNGEGPSYCGKHYQRLKLRGVLDLPDRKTRCTVEECDRPAFGRVNKQGPMLCQKHYQRVVQRGTTKLDLACAVEWCTRLRQRGDHCQIHANELARGGIAPEGFKRCSNLTCADPVQPMSEYLVYAPGKYGAKCRTCRRNPPPAVGPKYRHRLTATQYAELLSQQDFRCPICLVALGDHEGGKRPAIDHDHSCCPERQGCQRCVRSILCHPCNVFLGRSQDNPAVIRRLRPTTARPQEVLDRAVAYLMHWNNLMVEKGVRPRPSALESTMDWLEGLVKAAFADSH